MTEQGGIHDEHPFDTPLDQRDPARRFRGRLASPVTVVTAGSGERRTGLTVSSIMVAEGEPSRVYFLVGTTTDLYYVLEQRGKFVVHVLEDRHREMSDVFAGVRPSPGGRFAGLDVEDSDWGPVLSDVTTRAYCTFEGGDEETYFLVAEGVIDELELGDIDDPLAYFRGTYRSLR
jgi:3-hydroxy-9,10-secoandrosta-1,3,5(10)-triene-9,17-dione monooxygenase reductase component